MTWASRWGSASGWTEGEGVPKEDLASWVTVTHTMGDNESALQKAEPSGHPFLGGRSSCRINRERLQEAA